jgi:hypothetical protein
VLSSHAPHITPTNAPPSHTRLRSPQPCAAPCSRCPGLPLPHSLGPPPTVPTGLTPSSHVRLLLPYDTAEVEAGLLQPPHPRGAAAAAFANPCLHRRQRWDHLRRRRHRRCRCQSRCQRRPDTLPEFPLERVAVVSTEPAPTGGAHWRSTLTASRQAGSIAPPVRPVHHSPIQIPHATIQLTPASFPRAASIPFPSLNSSPENGPRRSPPPDA